MIALLAYYFLFTVSAIGFGLLVFYFFDTVVYRLVKFIRRMTK